MRRLYIAIIAIVISLFLRIDANAQRLTFSSELGYFIEYVLQRGGESEVLRLFEATKYDKIFELLNIATNEQAEFIRSLF